MKSRRDFLKKAALGSTVITSYGGLSILDGRTFAHSVEANIDTELDAPAFPGWVISFENKTSVLSLRNGPIVVHGKLDFVSSTDNWAIVNSRDGIPGRYALVDLKKNVQGYFVINQNCHQLQLLFYHRTAQAYQGVLSFEGEISFLKGSFACRTRARAGERVLALSCGSTNSHLDDSLFAPESDSLLQLNAVISNLKSVNDSTYSFVMSGEICESSEAVFTINLEKDYFRNRYVPYYQAINRKRCPRTPTGWMSWNTYFDKATAGDNLAEARLGKNYLQPFGCEFWSIESWQGNSDQLPVRNFHNMNLEVNEKQFPEGMQQLAEDIRRLGFRPGLWMAPFGTGNDEFYKTHKNWFLHDHEGNPITTWNGRYTLDPTVPEALVHLKGIFETASRSWGYEFFKIDGMSGRSHGYCAHLYERPEIRDCFHDPSCPNPFELCVKTFREGIGEDRVFLACQGHTSGPEALYADASRIGADIVHPNEPVKWENVLNQGRCTVNQIFTHNIAMIADPDTLLVHDLPLEEARVSATIVALPGQMTFFGDKLAGLSGDHMKMLQQTLPVANVRPVSLFPYFSMLPVWNLRVQNSMLGDYNVVALFNWEDETKIISFSTEELGVDSDAGYLMYEFWTQKAYDTISEEFADEIPAHSVRLFAMHHLKNIPQWVSSDRHIAQNAIELKEYEWKADNRTLEGEIELIASFPLTMRMHIPKDFEMSSAGCNGARCTTLKEENNILAVTFISDNTGDFKFRIRF